MTLQLSKRLSENASPPPDVRVAPEKGGALHFDLLGQADHPAGPANWRVWVNSTRENALIQLARSTTLQARDGREHQSIASSDERLESPPRRRRPRSSLIS